MSGLTTIRDAILRQLEPIRSRRAELKEEDTTLKEEEGRLERALVELDGGNQKKPKKKPKPKDDKPSVKREDVQPVCVALVADNPGITKQKLKTLAAEELHERGFSRNGMPLQIDKCIKSTIFSIGDDQTVTVANTTTDKASKEEFHAESNGTNLPVESLP